MTLNLKEERKIDYLKLFEIGALKTKIWKQGWRIKEVKTRGLYNLHVEGDRA